MGSRVGVAVPIHREIPAEFDSNITPNMHLVALGLDANERGLVRAVHKTGIPGIV